MPDGNESIPAYARAFLDMPYVLTLEDKPGYVHARVTGSNSFENVLGYTQEIHQACVHSGQRAVLIEENLAGPSISMSAIFQIVAERSPQALGVLKRIAYVDVNPGHDLTRMEFAEDVAVNRGVNMRLFATVGEAERWLQAELPES